MAGVLIFVVLISAGTILVFASQVYGSAVRQANLQWEANVAMTAILKGEQDAAGGPFFGLSSSIDYAIVVTNRNGVNFYDKVNFHDTSGTLKSYRQNGQNLIYNDGSTDMTIYTAPAGTTLSLAFYNPASPTDIGVIVSLSSPAAGGNITGCLSTVINIRNHPA
jgi:hypothetical protein